MLTSNEGPAMIDYKDELYHYGTPRMRWGVRRYQNYDGTLTEAGRRRLARKEHRWIRKQVPKIEKQASKASKREMLAYKKYELDPQFRGKNKGANYVNAWNKKLAEVMNTKVRDVRSPSGQALQFVAKRGALGVHTALTSPNFDASKQFKNGIWDSGRVAYRTNTVNRYEMPEKKR